MKQTPHRKTLIHRSFAVVCVAMISAASLNTAACELHAGMGAMGFGFQHPLMQQHLTPSNEQTIGLRIDRKRTVAKSEQTQIPLRFTIPNNYEQINVDVTTSDGLSLLSADTFKIETKMGKKDISIQALESGEQHVVLRVYGLKNNIPVTYTRKVKVIVG